MTLTQRLLLSNTSPDSRKNSSIGEKCKEGRFVPAHHFGRETSGMFDVALPSGLPPATANFGLEGFHHEKTQ
jgi:hypothetical protein